MLLIFMIIALLCRYAKSVALQIRLQSGGGEEGDSHGRIFPPTVEIIYDDLTQADYEADRRVEVGVQIFYYNNYLRIFILVLKSILCLVVLCTCICKRIHI